MAAYGLQPDYFVAHASHWLEDKKDHIRLVALQVKRHYNAQGDLDLTEQSLEKFAEMMRSRPERRAVMNCPLIGLGGFGDQQKLVTDLVERVLGDIDVIVCTL